VNIVVQNQEEDDLDYISSFAPTQIIRLEMRNYWLSLNLNTMIELRSLTLDCTYLSKEQLDQVTSTIQRQVTFKFKDVHLEDFLLIEFI
jgi:hypothetical protein